MNSMENHQQLQQSLQSLQKYQRSAGFENGSAHSAKYHMIMESTIMNKIEPEKRVETHESSYQKKTCPDFADIVSLEAANNSRIQRQNNEFAKNNNKGVQQCFSQLAQNLNIIDDQIAQFGSNLGNTNSQRRRRKMEQHNMNFFTDDSDQNAQYQQKLKNDQYYGQRAIGPSGREDAYKSKTQGVLSTKEMPINVTKAPQHQNAPVVNVITKAGSESHRYKDLDFQGQYVNDSRNRYDSKNNKNYNINGQKNIPNDYHQTRNTAAPNQQLPKHPSQNQGRIYHQYQTFTGETTPNHPMQKSSKHTAASFRAGEKENKAYYKNTAVQQSSSRVPLSYNNTKESKQSANAMRPQSTKNANNCFTSPKAAGVVNMQMSSQGATQKLYQQQNTKRGQQNKYSGMLNYANGSSKVPTTQRSAACASSNMNTYRHKENYYKAPQKQYQGAHSSGRVGKKPNQCSNLNKSNALSASEGVHGNNKAQLCATARLTDLKNMDEGHAHSSLKHNHQTPKNPCSSLQGCKIGSQLSGLSGMSSRDMMHATQQYSCLGLLKSSKQECPTKKHYPNGSAQYAHLKAQQEKLIHEHHSFREKQSRESQSSHQAGKEAGKSYQQHLDIEEMQNRQYNIGDYTAMDVIPELSSINHQIFDIKLATQRNKSSSVFKSGGGESAVTSSTATNHRTTHNPAQQKQYQQNMLSRTQTICNSSSQAKLGASILHQNSKTAQCPNSSRIFQFQPNQPGNKQAQASASRSTKSKGLTVANKESGQAKNHQNSIYNNYKSFIDKQKKIVAQLSQSKFQSSKERDNKSASHNSKLVTYQVAHGAEQTPSLMSPHNEHQSSNCQHQVGQSLSSTQKFKIQNDVQRQQQQQKRQHTSGANTHRRDFVQENKKLPAQIQQQNAAALNIQAPRAQKKSSSMNQYVSATARGSTKNLQNMTQLANTLSSINQVAVQQNRVAINASAISGLSQKSNSATPKNSRNQQRASNGGGLSQVQSFKGASAARNGATGSKSPTGSSFRLSTAAPALLQNGMSRQTSKAKMAQHQHTLNQTTVASANTCQKTRKPSDKSGKLYGSHGSGTAQTHRAVAAKPSPRPNDLDKKLKKLIETENTMLEKAENYESWKQAMSQTYNPKAVSGMLKSLQKQNTTTVCTSATADLITLAANKVVNKLNETINQRLERLNDQQQVTSKQISEQSRSQLVLQEQNHLQVLSQPPTKKVADEVQTILINSKQQSNTTQQSNGVVLLSSSHMNMSGKQSGCFGADAETLGQKAPILEQRQENERRTPSKGSTPSKRNNRVDKENMGIEIQKPAQGEKVEEECKQIQKAPIQEAILPQVLQQNTNKQNVIQANAQQNGDANKSNPTGQQQQAENKDLNDTMIFSNNSSLDDYIIGKQIGQGAYAVVRIGLHKPTNRKVAMKIYKKYKLEEPNRRRSVKREIKLMERMRHQNIIQLYEIIDTTKYVILIMEYVGGGSLHGYLKSKSIRRLEEWDAKRLFKQILEGLKYCHTRCITHRDIKLENLLLDDKNNIKIIDFGFSTCIPNDKKIKIFCGTPSYMAPEIVLKTEYCGPPADIWALGVLLFTTLSGQFPYRGATDEELYNKICKADYHYPPAVQNTLSPEAKDLIAQLFSVSADDRPTARDLLQHPWFQNVEASAKQDTSTTFEQAQEYLAIQKRAKSQRLDGGTNNKVPQNKEINDNRLYLNNIEGKSDNAIAFNPFKMQPWTPQNQNNNIFSPNNQQPLTSSQLQNLARSNSQVTLAQKKGKQDPSAINERAVLAIVDKLGYTKEEVIYLVKSHQGKNNEEASNSFVVTLYNKLLAEEQEREMRSLSATKKFNNPQTISKTGVSQTSIGLSANGPAEGPQSLGQFGIGNMTQKFGIQPSYVPSVKSLNSNNGLSSYLTCSNNVVPMTQKSNNQLISSSTKSNLGMLHTNNMERMESNLSLVGAMDTGRMQNDLQNTLKKQGMDASDSKKNGYGHKMLFNNFFSSATENQGDDDTHQQPAAFCPAELINQNKEENAPESPQFNKTQKISSAAHHQPPVQPRCHINNTFDDVGEQFEMITQRSKTPRTINNYGMSQRMQKN